MPYPKNYKQPMSKTIAVRLTDEMFKNAQKRSEEKGSTDLSEYIRGLITLDLEPAS